MANSANPATISLPIVTPFGLPPGSVRGLFSTIICAFFWLTLLWPGEQPVRALLAHFFLLGLVLMAFASHPHLDDTSSSPFLPWLLRIIFVGVSVAVVLVALVQNPTQLQQRLTPDPEEVKAWWIPFLAIMAAGFSIGLLLRSILGRDNHVFRSMRAWLSVVGMLMLTLELVLCIGLSSSDLKTLEFIHFWQCGEVLLVSAYFGTRA